MPRRRALTCQIVVEVLSDYLDDGLDWFLRARVETHLAGCQHCATYLEQLRQTVRWLRRVSPCPLSSHSRQACLDTFRAWRVSRG